MMATKPEDDAIRRQALLPDQSFIVQAPAGSGKTELLTRRVLTLLAVVDNPEEVLAITFTRKAAVEMQVRVFDTLHKASIGKEPADSHEAEGLALAEVVLARDAQLEWNLLRNPQRLNLRTIDSLATSLAYNLPVVSKLGAPASVVEDAYSLYREAAASFLNKHIESFDLVLLHLGNKIETAEKLLAEMLGKRDQWQNYVSGDLSTDDLRAGLEAMLLVLAESRLAELSQSAPLGFLDNILPLVNTSIELAKLIDTATDAVVIDGVPGSSIDDLPSWCVLADRLLTKAGSRRGRVTKNEGFPARPADVESAGLTKAELDANKKRYMELLEQLDNHPQFVEHLHAIRSLPVPAYDDLDWQIMEQLITTLPALLGELQHVFSASHQIDFTEIAMRARTAMGSEDEPTDLALAMDLRLSHILVDEFQDTSHTQFALFERLVAGWQPDDGKTFFAVGDPMQSIYRFREAEVTLFAQAQQYGIGETSLTPLALTVNFRSSPSVTNWVNHVFADLFPAQADEITGATAYAQSIAFKESAGSVTLHSDFNTDAINEATQVAQLTQQALGIDEEHTVAILVRSRTQALEIFPALQRLGIRYQAVEMDNLGDKAVVRDLISLTLALRFVHDRLHWLAVVRAPWCGLNLSDLGLLMHDSGHQPVIELLQDKKRITSLSLEGQQRVERLLSIMLPAVQRSARAAIMPWVESCWLALGGPVVCRDQSDLDASEQCIKKLQQLESRGLLWRSGSLYEAMKKLFAVGDAGDEKDPVRVQIMTMHKAKGLEFDTVIMPALHRKPRGDSKQLLSWFDRSTQEGYQLLLAPLTEINKKAGPILKLVNDANSRCDAQEVIRLLYVACTRAKQHLHLLGTVKHSSKGELSNPAKYSLLSTLWPILETEYADSDPGAPEQLPGDDEAEPIVVPELRQLPNDWQLPDMAVYNDGSIGIDDAAEVPSIEYLWASTSARDIGTVVHAQLQRLAEDVSAQQPEQLEKLAGIAQCQLRSLGMPESEIPAATDKVIKAIDNTLDDGRGKWILDAAHDDAKSEWALTATTDEGLRSIVIDRSFVDDGTRWIVDFKTGDHSGGSLDKFLDEEQARYTAQLSGYADILRLVEDRPIRAALYFPLLKAYREVPVSKQYQPPGMATELGAPVVMPQQQAGIAPKPQAPKQADLFGDE